MPKEDKYLKKLKEYEPVESEKDYWKKHKTFMKAIGGIYKNLKRFISNPKNSIDKFEEILNEGVRIQLITKEFKKKKMKKLLDELSKPSRFKQKAKEKIRKAKTNFKNKFRKKENQKKINISKKKQNKAIEKARKKVKEKLNKEEKT